MPRRVAFLVFVARAFAVPLALAFAVLLVAAPAEAMSLRPASLEDLAGASSRVIRGACVAVERRFFDDRGRGFRYFTFRIDEVVAGPPGAAGETVVLRVIDLGETLAARYGIPYFRPGDEAVLFLTHPNADGHPYVTGIGMGCYRVRADGTAVQEASPPPPKPAPGAQAQAAGRYVREAPVAALKAMIRDAWR